MGMMLMKNDNDFCDNVSSITIIILVVKEDVMHQSVFHVQEKRELYEL